MIREPRSEFVGRDTELRTLASLIEVERLVTLVGVGGVGKTRLAIRTANGWASRHDDPSWIVLLDTVADPGMLPLAVVRALGLATSPRGLPERSSPTPWRTPTPSSSSTTAST